jgi:hypothetical protein
MDAEQRGWYIHLISEAWNGNPQGTLPGDDKLLRVLACANVKPGDPRWEFVVGQFRKRPNGDLEHPWLRERRIDQEEHRRQRREAGLKSGASRRKQAVETHANHGGNGSSTVVERKSKSRSTEEQRGGNSSSSTSSSSSPASSPPDTSSKNTHARAQIEKIYSTYPRKRNKASALEAIRKALAQIPFDELLSRVLAYAKSREGEDQRFTPYPEKWFNNQGWMDELDAPKKPSNPARITPARGKYDDLGEQLSPSSDH